MVRAFLGNCAEVTHCMLVASEPVQIGGLGKDEPGDWRWRGEALSMLGLG